jgi:PEP-CTERM motif
MNCWSGRLLGTLLVLATVGGTARADMITPWTYSWSRNPISVAADNNGTGGISMSLAPLTPGTNMVGDSDIIAVSLSTFSSAPSGTVDTFTNSPFSLTAHLTDLNSNQSGTLTFNGVFNGTLSQTNAQITATFLSPSTQSIVLGPNTYTVALNSFVPPGLPNATVFGDIGAHVSIEDGSGGTVGIQTVPEPSTLLLVGMTLPAAGLALWRTRAGRSRLAAA